MKGFEALAGSLKTCADCLYGVPGFPVTELVKATGASLVISEKTALEYAVGDSIAGKRAAVLMKNVGLNACADLLVHATPQGTGAGIVIVAGDDPHAEGSQVSEDSRYYGELAMVPVLEPGPESCARVIGEAFHASERFSRVSIVRITPEILEAQVSETGCDCLRGRVVRGPASAELTMNGKNVRAVSTLAEMFAWSSMSPLNTLGGKGAGTGAAPGETRVVTVYPPPGFPEMLGEVKEIGRPFVREHRFLEPYPEGRAPQRHRDRGYCTSFCRGCPFIPLMDILKEKELEVIVDAGCSILAMNPPYRIGKASYGLGSAIGVAARSKKVALIGDYALLHSGIPTLIDVFEKDIPVLVVVLVNRVMGMTGGQTVPDPVRFVSWADPVVCNSEDREFLWNVISVPERPKVVFVEGTCPEGRMHERVEC